MNPLSAITSAPQSAGMLKQLFDFGTSLINPERVKRVVGKIATPIRIMPADRKDSSKPKEENEGKKDPTFFDYALARVTWLHVIGVLGLIGGLIRPMIDKFLGPPEKETFLRKAADWVFNAGSGIVALVLSEISFSNKWHVSGRERLEQLGVLEKVVGTRKWKELEVDKHLKSNKFPMDVDGTMSLLLEVRSSPKHRRASCFEGAHGTGKTLAAYICAYNRVQALKQNQVQLQDAEALQINAVKLNEKADEIRAKVIEQAKYLPENLRGFVSEDPVTYAFDEVVQELQKGSTVVNDDARYILQRMDVRGLKWLQEVSENYGGGHILTIPVSLEQVLAENENLKPDDRKTLLQRIDSISFPFEKDRKTFDELDDYLKGIITADLDHALKEDKGVARKPFHEDYLREQQVRQWKRYISSALLDDGEKFGRTDGVGKILNDYFTDEKINELVSKYPMNPRYIQLTLNSLAILVGNRRNKLEEVKEKLDFMLETILKCDTFRNYIRSVDMRTHTKTIDVNGKQEIKVEDLLNMTDQQFVEKYENTPEVRLLVAQVVRQDDGSLSPQNRKLKERVIRLSKPSQE